MIIIGLTGGIGSGKTTVAKMFSELGVPVYNSDIEAKKLMHTSKKVKNAIIGLLGPEAYLAKKLNKSYISSKVFADKKLLQDLNNIVHPAVREHFLAWVKKQKYPYVIQETALIFENNSQENYDKIILVKSPEDIRLQRVVKRDGSSIEAIKSRMKNQLAEKEKEKFSDYIIENIQLKETQSTVKQLHQEIIDVKS